jgi:3-phosphoshikimate 1-carboxyvinyltransferase
MFAYFGIPFHRDGCTVRIEGRPSVRWGGKSVVVPGDLSAAAFLVVGASIVPNSDVTVRSVGMNPTRTGLLEILRQMGAHIEVLNPREEAGEPVRGPASTVDAPEGSPDRAGTDSADHR